MHEHDSGRLHETVLGTEAVAAHLASLKIASRSGLLEQDSSMDETLAIDAESRQATTDKLAIVRSRINGMTGRQISRLNGYLDRSAPAELMESMTGDFEVSSGRHARQYNDWHQRLGGADDEGLLRFLQWNVDMLAEQQTSPQVHEASERLKAAYKTGLVRGFRENWLGERAEAAVDTVDDVPIVLGDAFSTIAYNTDGYEESGVVVIRAGSGMTAEERASEAAKHILHIGQHELNHRFFHFDGWRDESYAEHVDLGMKYGDIEVFDPDQRDGSNTNSKGYVARRRLESFVLHSGGVRIPVTLGTRAYSGSETDQAEYKSAVNESWGDVDAYGKINKTYAYYEAAYESQGLEYGKASASAASLTLKRLKANPATFFQQASYLG